MIPWPERKTGLYMGLGPTFVFPTASHRSAGQGAWQVGPAFAAIYKGVPGLLLGCLVQNPISFAYTSLLFQPIVMAYLGRGFYLKSADSTWTRGWHPRSPRLLPLSLGIGQVTVREGSPRRWRRRAPSGWA